LERNARKKYPPQEVLLFCTLSIPLARLPCRALSRVVKRCPALSRVVARRRAWSRVVARCRALSRVVERRRALSRVVERRRALSVSFGRNYYVLSGDCLLACREFRGGITTCSQVLASLLACTVPRISLARRAIQEGAGGRAGSSFCTFAPRRVVRSPPFATGREWKRSPQPATFACQNSKTFLQTDRSAPKGLNCRKNLGAGPI